MGRLSPFLDSCPLLIEDQVTENAKSMGATLTNGFLVGGVSAGGNLAAVVAHLSRDEKLQPPVTGTLLCVPVIMGPEIEEKYASEIRSYEELKDGPILNEKSLNNLLGRSHYRSELVQMLIRLQVHTNQTGRHASTTSSRSRQTSLDSRLRTSRLQARIHSVTRQSCTRSCCVRPTSRPSTGCGLDSRTVFGALLRK